MALIYPDHPSFRVKYPLVVKNSSGEVIPPCAVMAISGVDIRDGKAVTNVIKPTSTFARQYLVNSPIAIPSSSSAEGYASFLEDFGYVYYGSGTPAIGEEWGATSGQWYLTQNRPGFFVTAETTTFNDKNLVWAKGYLVSQVLGKPNATIAKDASNTVNVWGGTPGSEATTSMSVSSCFNKTGSGSYTTSDFVTIGWINGQPYISKFVC